MLKILTSLAALCLVASAHAQTTGAPAQNTGTFGSTAGSTLGQPYGSTMGQAYGSTFGTTLGAPAVKAAPVPVKSYLDTIRGM